MLTNLKTTFDNFGTPSSMNLTLPISEDDQVRMPLPFLQVGGGLAVFPLITPTGEGGFHCDFTRWVPGKLSVRGADTRLPLAGERTVAIHAALAFDADPRPSGPTPPRPSTHGSRPGSPTSKRPWRPEHRRGRSTRMIALQTTFNERGYAASMRSTAPLANGEVVTMPLLFLPIGRDLALLPAMAAEGEGSLRLDFTRWTPVQLSSDRGNTSLPFQADRGLAINAARAFDDHPNTHWTDASDAKAAWLRAWAGRYGQDIADQIQYHPIRTA